MLALEEDEVIEKSCPVPLSVTVCGESLALAVIVSVPLRRPLVVGSKKTLIPQLVPAPSGFRQLFTTPKSLGLTDTLVIVSVSSMPVFVTVRLWGRPAVMTY